MYKKIDAWEKRRGHQRLRRVGRKLLHLTITFILGVALATIYHQLVMNKRVRAGAERICEVFGRDAEECKDGIDDVLDMSDGVVDNNINVGDGGK